MSALQKLPTGDLRKEALNKLLFLAKGKRPARARKTPHAKTEIGRKMIQEYEMSIFSCAHNRPFSFTYSDSGYSFLWTVEIDISAKKQVSKPQKGNSTTNKLFHLFLLLLLKLFESMDFC